MTRGRHKLEIRLPEGVTFALPLGGPVTRCLAFLIDVCVIFALTTALEQIGNAIRLIQQDLGAGILIVFYLAAWLLYGILCEYYWNGQTIGKWLLDLRVMDISGLELRFYQIAVRNLIRTFDLLPIFGLVGGIAMLSTRRLQRLGDLAAGTVVVRLRCGPKLNIEALGKARYNSLLDHQLLCARLRQRVPAHGAGLALDALLGRDRLEDRARVLLFNELASYFQSLVEFPADSIDQLSSEQYVRDVLEVLYSSARTVRTRAASVTR